MILYSFKLVCAGLCGNWVRLSQYIEPTLCFLLMHTFGYLASVGPRKILDEKAQEGLPTIDGIPFTLWNLSNQKSFFIAYSHIKMARNKYTKMANRVSAAISLSKTLRNKLLIRPFHIWIWQTSFAQELSLDHFSPHAYFWYHILKPNMNGDIRYSEKNPLYYTI